MFIGIDIGGTNIKGVLTDKNGNIISYKKNPTGRTVKEIEDNIIGLIEILLSYTEKKEIRGIGIGTAGSIDKKKGIIITSPNIKSFKNHPLSKNIKRRCGIRVFLENDANAAIAGEWWKGHGRNFKNWIMLTLGTGIGGGAVINNSLYTGQYGNAMEVGHMTIKCDGKKCLCGNRGCLETYASATSVVKGTRSRLKKYPGSSIKKRIRKEELSSEIVYEEAVKGDSLAMTVFNEISELLGIGVANLINIFNPEAVIFGGGLSKAHRLILPVVKETVKERALDGLKENVKFLVTKSEGKLSALGAAKIAMDAIESQQDFAGIEKD